MAMLIKLEPSNTDHVDFAYSLLQERYQESNINISGTSHPDLPNYDTHKLWLEENAKDGYYIWIINNKMIAMATIRTNETNDLFMKNEVGIFVLKDSWGQGIGYEVMNALIELHPNTEIYARVNPMNDRSNNLFKKLGFEKVANIWRFNA